MNLPPPALFKADLSHGHLVRLFDHIVKTHDDWKQDLKKLREKGIIQFTNLASPKAKNIYGHLDDIISNNKTFSSVDNAKDRLYSSIVIF